MSINLNLKNLSKKEAENILNILSIEPAEYKKKLINDLNFENAWVNIEFVLIYAKIEEKHHIRGIYITSNEGDYTGQ